MREVAVRYGSLIIWKQDGPGLLATLLPIRLLIAEEDREHFDGPRRMSEFENDAVTPGAYP